ncbi:MAG: SpaH/EbpB family LPXTG-anchored major pilin [Oscillospiraceae bacterium]|nr:SpaH/EbpB family LPXTG-anchored major pilin [Oscillospiraceae bacterium]
MRKQLSKKLGSIVLAAALAFSTTPLSASASSGGSTGQTVKDEMQSISPLFYANVQSNNNGNSAASSASTAPKLFTAKKILRTDAKKAVITPGTKYKYQSWSTCTFNVSYGGSQIGFCLNPDMNTTSGEYPVKTIPKSSADDQTMYAAYLLSPYGALKNYAPNGNTTTGQQAWDKYAFATSPNTQAVHNVCTTHVLLSYLYSPAGTKGISGESITNVKKLKAWVEDAKSDATVQAYIKASTTTLYVASGKNQGEQDILWGTSQQISSSFSLAKDNWDGTQFLDGATFAITDAAGKSMGNGKAVSTGHFQWNNLDITKDYFVEETAAPSGYNKMTGKQQIRYTSNGRFEFVTPVKKGGDSNGYTTNPTSNVYCTWYNKPTTPKYYPGTIVIHKTNENGQQDLAGAEFTLYKADKTTVNKVLTTDAEGIMKDDKLTAGTYYLKETKAPAGYTAYADWIEVNVPENGTATATYPVTGKVENANGQIVVHDKLTPIDVHKYVQHIGNQDHTANIAEKETWIVSPQVPEDIATSKRYTITDPIDSRLTYNAGQTITVKPAQASGEPLTDTSKTLAKDDYTVTEPSTANQQTLTVDFTTAGRKRLAEYGAKRVFISFTTQINNTVIKDSLGTDIPNQAQLHFTNQYDEMQEPKTEIPEVHTGAVKLTKFGTNSAKLAGAEFEIFASEADAKNGKNPIAVTDVSGKRVTKVTTDKDGAAYFYGLAYGPKATLSEQVGTQQGVDAKASDKTNSTTYIIKEVKAPAGYQVNANALAAKVSGTDKAATVTVNMTDTATPVTPNTPVTSVPKTGDSTNIVLLLMVIAASGFGLFATLKKKLAK